MDAATLGEDLKLLCKGRGIRRPRPRQWIGPLLLHLLEVDERMSDDGIRKLLVESLRSAAAALPADLRYLYLMAVGVTSQRQYLEERLEEAGKGDKLDRGTRALRRRLRQAERLLAELMVERHEAGLGAFGGQAWYWQSQDISLVDDGEAMIVLDRRLVAVADGQSSVYEVFSIPGGGDEGVTFLPLDGSSSISVDSLGPGSWGVTITLVEPLRVGESRQTKLGIRLSSVRMMQPYLVAAPVRRHDHLRVSVDFGTPPFASGAWVLNAVVPSLIASPSSRGPAIDLDDDPQVGVTFASPHPGMAYGIAWEWAEPRRASG